MTSQPGLQTIHILLNISQSKCNKAMKFGQLKQNIAKEVFSFKNYAEYEAGWLVPDLFIFLKKLDVRWK